MRDTMHLLNVLVFGWLGWCGTLGLEATNKPPNCPLVGWSSSPAQDPIKDGGRSQECSQLDWLRMSGSPELTGTDAGYFRRLGQPVVGPALFDAPRAPTPKPGLRKEYRCLTDEERQKLHDSFRKMKSTIVGNQTQYDIFVLSHTFQIAPEAHFGPAFCPWHREFLHRFETALQEHNPGVMLPYWDNRMERRLKGNVGDSILFSTDFAGNGNGYVTRGFARGWSIANDACRFFRNDNRIFRRVGTNLEELYPEDAEKLTMVNAFQNMCTPWNTSFEDMHGGPHVFVGGLMSYITCSPNDPIFYFHHCFVDNLFQRFLNYSKARKFKLQYPDISPKNLPKGFTDNGLNFTSNQGAKHTMYPFLGLVNEYGLLSDTYSNLFYHYDNSPGDVTCKKDSDCCNSKYLWCDDKVSKKCIPKVAEMGRISAAFPSRACYCKQGSPYIDRGRCACTIPTFEDFQK